MSNYRLYRFEEDEQCAQAMALDAEALGKDAERYRMLRDNGYLDLLVGELHPCDEPRRVELTDKQIDVFVQMHARRASASRLDAYGKTHEGCAYLAKCGSVCDKCGQVA